MFWKAWKPHQQAMPAAATRPNRSPACGGDGQGAPDQHGHEQDQHARPHQAELLARDGEDEVGVLLGHEAGAGLRAVEEALAEEPAVADGDARLLGVVAGAPRVEPGVGEGEEAVDLVGLEHPHRHRGDGATDDAAERQARPATGGPRRRPRARRRPSRRARASCRGRAAAGSARRARRRSRASPTTSRLPTRASPPSFGALGHDERHADDHGELGELRGLDGHAAELDPRARPVDRAAGHEDQDEPADAGEVGQRRQDPHPPVVGGEDGDHQHQADGDVDQLLAEVGVGVAAGEVGAGRGGRPDEQRAERDEREGGAASAASRGRGAQAGRRAQGPGRRSAGGPGAGPGGQDGHRTHSPALSGTGGMIDPSSRNCGSLAGGTVPGIAARAGRTVSPSMP